MTASDSWGKPIVRIALLLCVLSFLLMVYAGYEYSNNTDDKILECAGEEANKTACNASKNISSELNSTRLFTTGVAQNLSSGKLNDSTLDKYFRAEIEKNPNIFSIAVAYSPDVHNGNRTVIHCKRNGSELDVSSTLPYDYANSSEETAAWYRNPMKSGCAGWNSPYFGIADGAYQIDYSAPFYLPKFKNGSEAAGVVCASYFLEGVRKQVGKLKLGKTGYGFVLSQEGVIISYPIQEYLFGNIHELAKENGEKNRDEDKNNLRLIYEKISKNKTYDLTYDLTDDSIRSNKTGKSSWVFYENISSINWTTNWTVGVVLPKEEVLLDKKIEQDCSVIRFILATFAFLFFLSVLFVSLYRYDDRILWMLALIFSFLCILGMGTVWHLTLSESLLEDRNEDIVVFDMADVETVLLHYDTDPKAPRVPT
ncbi:MAG: cache domain-containing protein, partial [Methanosarcina sp.]|nr:cache domain-containing protein [Methanosarcina sp.]